MAESGGTCPEASYWYNSSGRWIEVQEFICFHVDCPPWGCHLCLLGGGVHRNGRWDGTGLMN